MPKLELAGEPLRRTAKVELIVDGQHYEHLVLSRLLAAKVSIWIATANLKDLHVEAPVGTRARARGKYVSITERLLDFANRGVEIRILHASRPSGPFFESMAAAGLAEHRNFALRACPRVHLKMLVVDGASLYLGSANFTGAGLGAKGENRRNFEMGLCTSDDILLDAAQARFERIWSGKECGRCQLRKHCPAPLDGLASLPKAPPRSERTMQVKRRSKAPTVKTPRRRRALSPRPRSER